jgi:hypothetical protein
MSNCIYCGEIILLSETFAGSQAKTHYECGIRMVMGSVAHQKRECSCFGGTGGDDPNLSLRENAQLAFAYMLRGETIKPNET